MKTHKALLLGSHACLMQPLPSLLFRAGFEVEAITLGSLLGNNQFVTREIITHKISDFIVELGKIDAQKYDLIVPADDAILKIIRDCNLDMAQKISLLPIIDEKYLSHIVSKINLSHILAEAKILTPPFLVVKTQDEALQAAQVIGFPLLLKVDFSSGGDGVLECQNIDEIRALPPEKFNQPLLLQKKIEGREIDLSGMFKKGELIYFSYSLFKKTINKFGPSSLRAYYKSFLPEVFTRMKKIGKALGADGFANVSAILTDAGEVYFFEVDMRPNIWIDFAKFIGDDPALRIKKYFAEGEIMRSGDCQRMRSRVIPHFLRLKLWQILCNYRFVWFYMSKADWQWVYRMVVCCRIKILWRSLKRFPTSVIHFLLPQKHVRRVVKSQIRRIFVPG